MVNEEDLNNLRELIYKKTGMFFDKKKNYLIRSRLEQRMRSLKLERFRDYNATLMFEKNGEELQHFLESITINETYFFRDFPQLQGFAEQVLTEYLKTPGVSERKKLDIWSAACSTGEEPYTLSIILQEMIPNYRDWKLDITASDMDRNVLFKAKEGIYSERSMRDTPLEYKKKYFKEISNGQWMVLKDKTIPIEFKELNFMDRFGMMKMRNLDFIFCRNVLIYFDEVSRKRVIASLYDALAPGGYLFLGHSESIGRITASFELKNIDGFLCYRRPQ